MTLYFAQIGFYCQAQVRGESDVLLSATRITFAHEGDSLQFLDTLEKAIDQARSFSRDKAVEEESISAKEKADFLSAFDKSKAIVVCLSKV